MMKWLLSLFGLCCLALVGCAPVRLHLTHSYQYIHAPVDPRAVSDITYLVYLDKDFGEADLIVIEDALHQWNYVMNGYAHFQLVNPRLDMTTSMLRMAWQQNAFIIFKINSDSPLTHPHSLGFVNYVGGHHMYLVRDRLSNDQVLSVTLHELGHTLGAQHMENTLMAPKASLDDYPCVDYQTAVQVATYHGWDVHHLNYCLREGDAIPVDQENTM